MKNPSEKIRSFVSWFRVGVAYALSVLVLNATAPRLAAQSSDFNAGNDTGWQHYSLPNIPNNTPPYYLPVDYFGAATYSFPADDTGGKAYRIFAPAITNDIIGAGNARGGSFRTDGLYSSRFSVGADFLSWNAIWRQEAGFILIFSDVGLGTSDGYTATYSSAYQQLYISSILNERETTVAELGTGTVVLDPTHRYRLVASTHNGWLLLFQLFDKAEPNSPWVSAIGQDYTYYQIGGVCGLFVYQQDAPPSTSGADATFDNYVATVPAAGTMPAIVTDLTPPPASKPTQFYPTISVGILDRDTSVDTASILLSMDGVWVPNSSLTIDPFVHKPRNPGSSGQDFAGATVTYSNTTLFPWGSKHTNSVAFRDSTSAWRTNTWTWTTAYPQVFASNSLPIGSLNVRGFDVRMVQSTNGGVNLANSLDRARQQLAIPPIIPVDLTATSIVQTLIWDKTAAPPGNVPGLCSGSYNNIAVESFAYLELTPGIHRFHISSDDRAGLYSGVSLVDPNAPAIWENPGNTADTTFEFFVEAAGLYPVRCIWEETGGGAHLSLNSVNLGDLSEVPINDPGNPAGVVKAWYPLVCRSAASLTGPYAVDSSATHSLNAVPIVGADCGPTEVGQMVTGGTFTVPIPAATRFYRLDSPRGTRITNIAKSGSNLVITYKVL